MEQFDKSIVYFFSEKKIRAGGRWNEGLPLTTSPRLSLPVCTCSPAGTGEDHVKEPGPGPLSCAFGIGWPGSHLPSPLSGEQGGEGTLPSSPIGVAWPCLC